MCLRVRIIFLSLVCARVCFLKKKKIVNIFFDKEKKNNLTSVLNYAKNTRHLLC